MWGAFGNIVGMPFSGMPLFAAAAPTLPDETSPFPGAADSSPRVCQADHQNS